MLLSKRIRIFIVILPHYKDAFLILIYKQHTLMQEKRLFLLDAYALIYRSYYAFIKNPRINSKGINTSAILGFVNTLEEL